MSEKIKIKIKIKCGRVNDRAGAIRLTLAAGKLEHGVVRILFLDQCVSGKRVGLSPGPRSVPRVWPLGSRKSHFMQHQ